jgi:hypothetical protein
MTPRPKIVGYRLVVHPKSAAILAISFSPDPSPMSPEKQKWECEYLLMRIEEEGLLPSWFDVRVEAILEGEQ